MTILSLVAALLALMWGLIWALILQFTKWGKFIVRHRTWIAVAVGFGVDIAILGIVLELTAWLNVMLVVAASAIPIIARSLLNEYAELEDAIASAVRND